MSGRGRRSPESLEPDRRQLAAALFADLFVGPARRVSVFFPDLFGMTEVYNAPGTVDPSNWTLRVPPGYRALYAERCARGRGAGSVDGAGHGPARSDARPARNAQRAGGSAVAGAQRTSLNAP